MTYELTYFVWRNPLHKEDGTGPHRTKEFDAPNDRRARQIMKKFVEDQRRHPVRFVRFVDWKW